MRITVLLFGIAKDIIGSKKVDLEMENGCKVGDVKQRFLDQYPRFENLKYLTVAVNNEYASNEKEVQENDEIALIPPVSGG